MFDVLNVELSLTFVLAYNFHDDDDKHLGSIDVRGGSDALEAFWNDLGSEIRLFASHSNFLKEVAKMHNAHW